jgi:hypothetical protein
VSGCRCGSRRARGRCAGASRRGGSGGAERAAQAGRASGRSAARLRLQAGGAEAERALAQALGEWELERGRRRGAELGERWRAAPGELAQASGGGPLQAMAQAAAAGAARAEQARAEQARGRAQEQSADGELERASKCSAWRLDGRRHARCGSGREGWWRACPASWRRPAARRKTGGSMRVQAEASDGGVAAHGRHKGRSGAQGQAALEWVAQARVVAWQAWS